MDNEEDSRVFGKPDIILFYNATKRGVDTVDKYKESYSVARTTNCLSVNIFYSMLNVGALNSFIILNQPQMKRRIFLEELAKDLCRDFMVSCLTVLTHKKENPKLWKMKKQNEYHLQIKTPKVDVTAVTGRKIVLLNERSSLQEL